MRDKVTRQVSIDHNLFEEKGEPKQIRTDVPLLTSLTPYRKAKPAHIVTTSRVTYFIPQALTLVLTNAVKKQGENLKKMKMNGVGR